MQDLYTINDFCEKFDISRPTFYEIRNKYNLPKLTTTPLKARRKYISQKDLDDFKNFIASKVYVS